jgi:3D-(3,5/4)-trihydroxycyclohexane-1,2-dione acylhydrolase (decyclizing)
MIAVMPDIDFRAHAESMGAVAVQVSSNADLETAIESKGNDRTSVIVIDTDPLITTEAGGHWWDVEVPEVSPRSELNKARIAYMKARAVRTLG